ncbi:cytochrome c biogenesis heme-transporting ATPase CcmA [Polynucleobacter sp. MWH-Mekk-B1]|uniref:cytochrome c biogenesis heme-transporting ATPase CcmA n=1 Tax=Polynucleobacter finlandensis TaxID=1855894 RepID=UPI001C0B09AA|nr:cytochrome c biogenesis heme-transporting ATPase CcmA [Polynucleobacter finlandensis]MBU3544963.1 cytochrome c biogenesis heme-transporting ATPase CcmA [Polynucleobacter finlandensis]
MTTHISEPPNLSLKPSSLRANALTCVRGERTLFTGLDLEVSAGEWLHVRGENGIGKTSLLRLLSGLTKPAAGEIFWNEQLISADPSEYHRNLLFLGHRDSLKEDLTALENLSIATALDGIAVTEDKILLALHRFGLRGREDLPVNCLSAGQKRRVLLARLLLRQAKLWILDEPFNALDVRAVEMLSELILEHIASGGMAIMTSHQEIPMPNGRVVQL